MSTDEPNEPDAGSDDPEYVATMKALSLIRAADGEDSGAFWKALEMYFEGGNWGLNLLGPMTRASAALADTIADLAEDIEFDDDDDGSDDDSEDEADGSNEDRAD